MVSVIRQSRTKGLNLDFRFRLLPVWWARTAVGSLRWREPERPVASAKGRVVAGKTAGITAARLLAPRQRCVTVFQDPEQQILYSVIASDIAFSLRNLGCWRRKSRAASTALTLADAQHFRAISAHSAFESWAKRGYRRSAGAKQALIYCWMNPLLVSIRRAHSDDC